jgi:putative transposase
VLLMCQVLQVSASGYYAWSNRGRSDRERENSGLLVEIRAIHQQSKCTYGSPRITAELQDRGYQVNKKRVARLMRVDGLRPKTVRRFRVTTDSRHNHRVAPNLLNRSFAVAEPNRIWLSDITYIWTAEGWLYLCAVLDLYSRKIVGYEMNDQIDAGLSLTALERAWDRRQPPPGMLHHSDRGVQYACEDFRKLLQEKGLIASMSRSGDCWDNAPMESFFGTLKQELIYHERFETRREAKSKIFEYIEVFYNSWRRHSSLGSISPVEFERRYKLDKRQFGTLAS